MVADGRAGDGVDAVELGLAHEDAPDPLDAPECHLRQHRRLDLLEEDVVLLLLAVLAVRLLRRAIVDDAHAQHELVGVVIVADDVQLAGAVLLRA